MWYKLAIALTAAVSLGVAAMPTGVAARSGGGGGGGHGGGGGGHGGGFSGGRGPSIGNFHTFSAPVNRGLGTQTFVNRNITSRNVTSAPVAGRQVMGNGRWAMIGGHRHHGRHIHGFIPGIGYGWYWYYDDCYVLTDYGWVNMCGYDY